MKKTLIFASLMIAAIVSCQKEQNDGSEELLFTATISQSDTKTTVNTDVTSADRGKISWEIGDEIQITNYRYGTAYYEVASIDESGRATLRKTSGVKLGTEGTNEAIFGYAPRTVQTYGPVKDVYMYARTPATESELNFSVHSCGLLRVNVTDATNDIKCIQVTGCPTGCSLCSYKLMCEEAQDVTSAKDFYIVIPDGNYTKIEFFNSKWESCIKSSSDGIDIVEGGVTSIKFEHLPAFTSNPTSNITELVEEQEIHFI